jgi:hypothetical protein
MDLQSDLADAQRACGLLVEQPGDDQCQDLALAGRQQCKVLPEPRQLGALQSRVAILCDCRMDGMEQLAVAERSRQKVDRSRLDSAHAGTNVEVIRDEDDGETRRGELALQVEPTRVWKIHIQDEAGRRVGLVTLSVFRDRSEGDGLQAAGDDERAQHLLHVRITAHDEYDVTRGARTAHGNSSFVAQRQATRATAAMPFRKGETVQIFRLPASA